MVTEFQSQERLSPEMLFISEIWRFCALLVEMVCVCGVFSSLSRGMRTLHVLLIETPFCLQRACNFSELQTESKVNFFLLFFPFNLNHKVLYPYFYFPPLFSLPYFYVMKGTYQCHITKNMWYLIYLSITKILKDRRQLLLLSFILTTDNNKIIHLIIITKRYST